MDKELEQEHIKITDIIKKKKEEAKKIIGK